MDEQTVIESRRDAYVANLRRAYAAPSRGDLPTAFTEALRRLAEGIGPRESQGHKRAET